jgi:GT2 family glycosyltransferase
MELAKLFEPELSFSMNLPKISIIIVTWNGLHHLKNYLPSVCNTDYPNFEIIIADNASDDESITWINQHYPQCKIAALDENFGYAGGNNRAAELANGEILLFLNNDVEVTKDWLNEISKAFLNQSVAVVQPKIRSVRQNEQFEYAGAAGGYIDWLGYPFCRGRIFDTIETDNGQYDDKTEIFWASGAAFAIRKKVFEELNGFDPSFEFHMEEIDLCWRTLKSGYSIQYIPDSVVYHLGGGSMPENSPRKIYYNFRNSLLMLLKNLDRFVALKIFARLTLDGFSGIKFLYDGKPKNTVAVIRAHFAFYSLITSVIKKRKRYSVSNTQLIKSKLIYSRLIPYQYFICRKRTYKNLHFQNE